MTSNIVREPMDRKTMIRIRFLHTFIIHKPTTCPECNTELINDTYETYCPHCGLVTSTTYDYVAGFHITLPYGKK